MTRCIESCTCHEINLLYYASCLMFASLTQFYKIPGNWKMFSNSLCTSDNRGPYSWVWIPMMTLFFINYFEKNIYYCYFMLYLCHLLFHCIYILLPEAYCCEYFSIHTSNFLPLRTKSFLCIHEMWTIILLRLISCNITLTLLFHV